MIINEWINELMKCQSSFYWWFFLQPETHAFSFCFQWAVKLQADPTVPPAGTVGGVSSGSMKPVWGDSGWTWLWQQWCKRATPQSELWWLASVRAACEAHRLRSGEVTGSSAPPSSPLPSGGPPVSLQQKRAVCCDSLWNSFVLPVTLCCRLHLINFLKHLHVTGSPSAQTADQVLGDELQKRAR